jgi:translation elongation factor aEF-1 beta
MPAVVLVVARAYPKELLEKFDNLIEKIAVTFREKGLTLMRWEPIDIAFGYKALDLYVIMPEEQEGGTDILEETLRNIEEIDNVDIVYITRLST